MRKFIDLSSFVSKMMIKLSQVPGLGFLQNYVLSARAVRYQLGDQKEDYENYLNLGQNIMGDVKGAVGRPPREKNAGGDGEDEDDVYDDYEYDEENDASSSAYRPVDDYPVSDDKHAYYDDDYRSN
jgi:hypothetical protein